MLKKWFFTKAKMEKLFWSTENKRSELFASTLFTLIAPIFRVNQIFERRNPRTGIWSTWYLLLRTDGIPSTAFRIFVSTLYSSVDNFFNYCARATVFTDIVTTAYFFWFFTRQSFLFLQVSHCSLRKNTR